MKPARRKADSCRNIESAITIKISKGPQNGRVADAVALVRAQAAVRVYDKDRHIKLAELSYAPSRSSRAVNCSSSKWEAEFTMARKSCSQRSAPCE